MDTATLEKPESTVQRRVTATKGTPTHQEVASGLRRAIYEDAGATLESLASPAFKVLEGHRFMSLTSFRKNGDPVITPVWFALKDGKVYVTTDKASGKIKRIHNDRRVVLAPSTYSGRQTGPAVGGEARILPLGEQGEAAEALHTTYGWLLRSLELLWRMMGKQHTYLEIVPGRG